MIRKNKKAQMKMSFGMIFSIILIIIFIGFTIYAVKKFSEFKEVAEIGRFKDNLQRDIDTAWASSKTSQPVEYTLPSKILKVCFRNEEFENMIFKTGRYLPGHEIEHIDFEKTLGNSEEFCVDVVEGRVKMTIFKDYSDSLVTLTA